LENCDANVDRGVRRCWEIDEERSAKVSYKLLYFSKTQIIQNYYDAACKNKKRFLCSPQNSAGAIGEGKIKEHKLFTALLYNEEAGAIKIKV